MYMKLLGFEINKTKQPEEIRSIFNTYADDSVFTYSSSVGISFNLNNSQKLSACFRASNIISDGIASLQLKIYKKDSEGFMTEDFNHPLYNLLTFEPNPLMSRTTKMKLDINSQLFKGDSFTYINRTKDKSRILSLDYINPDAVKDIYTVNGELKYIVDGYKGAINSSNMIHILNQPTSTGYRGRSTISYAFDTLKLASSSELQAQTYFEGGANTAGMLNVESKNITPEQKKQLRSELQSNPNGISIVAGIGTTQYIPMGISPKDAQLLETRTFNIAEIGRFFNVNPILLFDNTKNTYNNIENAQLDFYNTTLLPIVEKIENEYNRKCILPSERMTTEIRFDLSNLLKMDSNSQAKYFQTLFGMGVISANQIARTLGLPKIVGEGGDRHYVSTNLQDTNNLIVSIDNSIDNKLLQDNEDDEQKNNEL